MQFYAAILLRNHHLLTLIDFSQLDPNLMDPYLMRVGKMLML